MCAMSFQSGGEQGSSAVLQDSQDFLWQMWRPAQNLPAPPGKWRHTCTEMGFKLAASPSHTGSPLFVCCWHMTNYSPLTMNTEDLARLVQFLLRNVFNTTDHIFAKHGSISAQWDCCSFPFVVSVWVLKNDLFWLFAPWHLCIICGGQDESILNSFSVETRWSISQCEGRET